MSQLIQLSAEVPADYSGKRLDQVLALLFPEHSRARLQAWIRAGQVTVDGTVKRPRDKVAGGEAVAIVATVEADARWQPEAIDLTVVYADEALIIINKPAGLVVHPAAGNREGTLVNALLHAFPELATLPRAGIVHRLDKDTTGLMVVARTLAAHTQLVAALQAREITREYGAVVVGRMVAGGTVNAPMGRHPLERKRMAVVANGKPAVSHYRVEARYRHHTYIQVTLETGRTHQIRVHMAHIHHPVMGDKVYGGRLRLPKDSSAYLQQVLRDFKRQALHAFRLAFIHPLTGEWQEWRIPLSEDMQQLLTALQQDELK